MVLFEMGRYEAALADLDREHDAEARDWAADADGYRAHLARLQRHELAVIARARRGLISEGALDAELAAIGRERRAVRDQLDTAGQALGAAQDRQARLRGAGEALAEVRDALGSAAPEHRRALLGALLRSSVALVDGRARLDLRLPRGAGAGSRADVGAIALVQHPGCRTEHGAILRLRLVA
jgi:uncharacterized protein (DUF3084 family)